MWKKASRGLKILTIFNILSVGYILLEYSRGAGVTYFLTVPVFMPVSLMVLAFDLYLVIGAILAVVTGREWWWKVGLVNFGYALMIDLLVIAKLFFGSKSGVMGLSEFWINLMIYGGQMVFFGLLLQYWLLNRAFFKVKK